MRITESRLRQIIKETLLEEQHRIDESITKDAITKGLLALMMTYTPSAVLSAAEHIASQPEMIELQDTHTYKGLKGEELIDYVLKNGQSIPNSDLDKVAIALGDYARPGHSSVGASSRNRHNDAVLIIKNRLDNSPESRKAQMYGVGKKYRGQR